MRGNRIRRLACAAITGLRDFRRCRRGVSAVEFALVAPILVAMLANTVDIGRLTTTYMLVQNAAEMGAQRALKNCMGEASPVTTNCSNLTADITTAIQSTWLGADVTLSAGPTANYYCMNGSIMQNVGSADTPPSPYDCTAVGDASSQPGEYVELTVEATFTKLFPFSVVPSPKQATANAMMRVN